MDVPQELCTRAPQDAEQGKEDARTFIERPRKGRAVCVRCVCDPLRGA